MEAWREAKATLDGPQSGALRTSPNLPLSLLFHLPRLPPQGAQKGHSVGKQKQAQEGEALTVELITGAERR